MIVTAPPAPALAAQFVAVREMTECLAAPLSAEDQTVQSMPDASPTKWHRAHTSWFFEEFLLGPTRGYAPYDPAFSYLFNSYYEALGPRHPRPERGLITRPSAAEVGRYRAHVEVGVHDLFTAGLDDAQQAILELGVQHEQQHQELLVMDAKHLLSRHPLGPAMLERPDEGDPRPATPVGWLPMEGGLTEIGHAGEGFAFDNEQPRHTTFLAPFEIADQAVTNQDWMTFMADDGYRRPEFWLSDGWSFLANTGVHAPGYWQERDGEWQVFTAAGMRAVVMAEPVCHVSFFEADAFARWAGGRLPTEAEWESSALHHNPTQRGALLEPTRLHPGPAGAAFIGDVWHWTSSAYLPYPGFTAVPGAVGEYNGKFMNDQHVLRGASCATPASHARVTYRNFFPASTRWAFSGLRLARS